MRDNYKHLVWTVLLGVAIGAAGIGLFAWPNYRRDLEVRADIEELDEMIRQHTRHQSEEESLRDRVRDARLAADWQIKSIPGEPDVASLMRRLSLPVDQTVVFDQTFTAGSAASVLGEDPPREMLMPLTVDMEATFDSVFALLRSAEVLDRLVRISTVRLSADSSIERESTPILTASVGLEAIYLPDEESSR